MKVAELNYLLEYFIYPRQSREGSAARSNVAPAKQGGQIRSKGEFRGEFTYRLDFDGTWTLFILTPAAWPASEVGAFLRGSHVA